MSSFTLTTTALAIATFWAVCFAVIIDDLKNHKWKHNTTLKCKQDAIFVQQNTKHEEEVKGTFEGRYLLRESSLIIEDSEKVLISKNSIMNMTDCSVFSSESGNIVVKDESNFSAIGSRLKIFGEIDVVKNSTLEIQGVMLDVEENGEIEVRKGSRVTFRSEARSTSTAIAWIGSRAGVTFDDKSVVEVGDRFSIKVGPERSRISVRHSHLKFGETDKAKADTAIGGHVYVVSGADFYVENALFTIDDGIDVYLGGSLKIEDSDIRLKRQDDEKKYFCMVGEAYVTWRDIKKQVLEIESTTRHYRVGGEEQFACSDNYTKLIKHVSQNARESAHTVNAVKRAVRNLKEDEEKIGREFDEDIKNFKMGAKTCGAAVPHFAVGLVSLGTILAWYAM